MSPLPSLLRQKHDGILNRPLEAKETKTRRINRQSTDKHNDQDIFMSLLAIKNALDHYIQETRQ